MGISNQTNDLIQRSLTQFQQFQKAMVPKAYEAQMTTRVSVPIQSSRWGGGRMEMTIDAGDPKFGPPKIEFTLVLPGREAIDFSLHPVDLDSLVSQRTMDKLSR